MSPLSNSKLNARRRASLVETSAPSQFDRSEDRLTSVGARESVTQFIRRDRPRLSRLVTRHAPTTVGSEIREERIRLVNRAGRVQRAQHAGVVRERERIALRIRGCDDRQRDKERRDIRQRDEGHAGCRPA
jgi:hypothetical protein